MLSTIGKTSRRHSKLHLQAIDMKIYIRQELISSLKSLAETEIHGATLDECVNSIVVQELERLKGMKILKLDENGQEERTKG